MTARKHRTSLPQKLIAIRSKLAICFIRAPFRNCTINPPENLKKRRLQLGPRISVHMLISLIGGLLLSCSYIRFMLNATCENAIYTDEIIEYPHHSNQSDFAIFYHVFVPPDKPEQENAFRIIKEQIHQIGKSYAHSTHRPQIYFNTVGAPDVVTKEYMAKYCNGLGLECEHMNHYDEGLEELTLEAVHDYCTSKHDVEDKDSTLEKDSRRVIYMHNKGSFHQNAINEQWRRLLTYSVTSEECLHPPDSSCNLCGLYFVAERGFFMPGNFWTARCDYVARLMEPNEFSVKSTEVMKEALLKHLKHEFDFDMYNFIVDNYGVERYAAELWAGSHPSIKPCDLSFGKKENFGTGYGHPFFRWVLSIWDPFQFTFRTLHWSMAPSLPMKIPLGLSTAFKHWGWSKARIQKEEKRREKKRMREFTYLAGNLFKWIHIYGEIPHPESWIWTWFPDGDKWRNGIDDHGKDVVEILTKKSYDTDLEFVDPVFFTAWRRKDTPSLFSEFLLLSPTYEYFYYE